MRKDITKKDKLTILINEEVKKKYKEYCKKLGLIIGKQIEIFMENELGKIEKNEINDEKDRTRKKD